MRNTVACPLVRVEEDFPKALQRFPDLVEIPNAKVYYNYKKEGTLAIIVNTREEVAKIRGD